MKPLKKIFTILLPICSILIMIFKPIFVLRWNSLFTGMIVYLMFFAPLFFLIPDLIKSQKIRNRVENSLLIICSTFFLFGGILGFMVFEDKKESLLNEGISVIGTIIGKTSIPSRRDNACFISIEYVTKELIKYQKEFVVSQAEYNDSSVGRKIEIIYSPKDYKISKPILGRKQRKISTDEMKQIFDDYLEDIK